MAFLAIVAVACGMKFISIDLNNKTPMQGATVTLTAKLEEILDHGDDQNIKDNFYQLFAVRVPEDWTGVSAKATPDETSGTNYDMIVSKPYADFCEFCFPREGYKWVAFQSEGGIKQGEKAKVVAKLKVGNAMGDYTLDVLAGGWLKNPKELFLDNGDVNLILAFGNNYKFEDFSVKDNKYFNSSEYLFIAGTISDEEYKARREAVAAEYSATITIEGKGTKEYPVIPDIANLTPTLAPKVTVVVDPSGIAEVENDLSGNVEYYNLQGIRVENPENGIFIRRQGNKTTKVYVK